MPLISRSAPLVVAWTPKTACSHVLQWFLATEGMLEAALAHDPWPHKYRRDIYGNTLGYRARALMLAAGGTRRKTLLRVTRNPRNRVVSIFRHALRARFLWADIHQTIGVNPPHDGLSFAEFASYMAQSNMRQDQHLMPQSRPIWDLNFKRIITVNIDTDDLDTALANIAQEFGLSHDRAALNAAQQTLGAHHHNIEDPTPVTDLVNHRFFRTDAARMPMQQLRDLPLAQELATRYFAADIGRVATADTANAVPFAD